MSVQKITIAIDAMGGSNAPLSVIKAIKKASQKHKEVHFLVYGDDEAVSELLKTFEVRESAYTIFHTNSVILDTDKATEALKGKKDSSMKCAIDAVLSKTANACVSSGNTGALMLTARMVLGSITDVKRPAIAGIFPTLGEVQSQSVLLDMGANIGCDEVALSQFAAMGVCFAKIMLGKENPSVGILNVGTEQIKGRELEQKTHTILSDSMKNFVGYVEGHDVINGKADVIVTDGFSGNIFLKASEGTAKVILKQFREAIDSNLITKLCGLILKPYIKRKLHFLDPRHNNGAMLIGINGIVVKSHGGSDDVAFANAIDIAINLAKNDVNAKILAEMQKLEGKTEVEFSTSDILTKIKKKSAKILGMVK